MQLPSERLTVEAVRWMTLSGIFLCIIAILIEVARTDCSVQSAERVPSFICERPAFNIAQALSLMALVLGSALIGGGISQKISGRRSKELLEDVSHVLQNTFAQPAIYSKPEKVARYTKRYCSYHVTRRNGARIWRMTVYDFTKSPAVNKLLCTPIGLRDTELRTSDAKAEGFARGAHLVFCIEPSDDEPKFMRIYPTAGFGFHTVMWGISTHMDFHKGRGIYKCLLSEQPLVGVTKPGDITEADAIAALDLTWNTQFEEWGIDLRNVEPPHDA